MNYYKRNEDIKKLHGSGRKPKDLAKKHKISVSRVYQILRKERKYCKKHSREYYSMCVNCNHEKSLLNFYKAKDKQIELNLVALKFETDREDIDKIRKDTIMILRDKYNLSFPVIGELISRKHTTVLYHYNKS